MARERGYAVNEVPPLPHLLVSSLQHVLLMVSALVIPILFASQLSGSPEFTANLIAFSMLAAGIGSIIQSAGVPFIGSGYLCPNVCGPSYFSVSLSAAWIGGIPLMRGMIILAGLVEMAIAPLIQRLRKVFPTFIVGLVVAMVGVSILAPAITSFFGLAFRDDAIRSADMLVGGGLASRDGTRKPVGATPGEDVLSVGRDPGRVGACRDPHSGLLA